MLICAEPGMRTRLTYRTPTCHRRKGEPKGFGVEQFKTLLQATHTQLDAPISLVWNSLSEHLGAEIRAWIAAQADWLPGYRLPTYTPDLNPAETVWAHMKRSLANLTTQTQYTGLAKNRLKRIQYRPKLISGFPAKTCLDLSPL